MFRPFRFAVLLAGAVLAFSASAQSGPDDNAAVDPPSRVARLSYIQGAVSFVPAGENDWVEAQLNRPLITGDKLWTDRDSRAALEIGAAAVRMDSSTSFDFLNLTDNEAQMELTQGTLNLRVRRLYDGQSYEIDTPTLAFVVNRVGMFRIDVDPDGRATTVTVLSGGGDVYGENGARFAVDEGQSVVFYDPQLRDYSINDLPRIDAFDDFCHERDTRWDDSPSRRYVSEDVIGYQDLDTYGSWSDVPEYGNVWYPTSVAVGWSPYHHGHWAWIGAYGWTWIDDSPWGFAPFHYGRWAYIGNRWGWCPGPISYRPVYAPALVAFVGGFHGGVSISVGGPIGWFPLGPRDVYFPSYHVSHGYFSRVNVSNTVINTTVINNYYGNYSRNNIDYSRISYANRNIAGAVTAVPAAAFVASRPVAGAALTVNRAEFAQARVHGFATVAPTRASLARDTAARAVPTAAIVNRPIVAATRPPAPVTSFAQRQTLLDKNPGRPLNEAQLRAPVVSRAAAGTREAAPAITARPNVRVVTQQGAPVRSAAPTLPTVHRAADGSVRSGTKATADGSVRPIAPNTRSAGDGSAHPNPTRETTQRFGDGSVRPVAPNTRSSGDGSVRPNPTQETTQRFGDGSVRPVAPNTRSAGDGSVRPATQAPNRLDSSRFAHPQGNSTPRNAPVMENSRNESRGNARETSQPASNSFGNRNVTPPSSRQEYRAPTQQSLPVRETQAPSRNSNVQEYRSAPAPQRSVQEYQAPQRHVQEYRAPAQPQRQEYQAPQRSVQEYHAPAQPQRQEYRAPQPQQFHAPQPQVQHSVQQAPRSAPQPAQRQQSNDRKDDDNKRHRDRN